MASGAGLTGGAGGAATGSAEAVGVRQAYASLNLTGGTGGSGFAGANGGAGADVAAANLVSARSPGGQISLSEYLRGGAGGYSQGGTAAAGGTASGSIAADYTLAALPPQAVSAGVRAVGGNGGGGGGGSAAAAGGAAAATASVKSGGRSQAQVMTIGGAGGGALSGNGGAGGQTTATSAYAAATVVASASAYATGGAGGSGYGAGYSGGAGADGGPVAATAVGGLAAMVRVSDTGGAGGAGQGGADGGAGGSSAIADSAGGSRAGYYFSLYQAASGGEGGASSGGTGGAGGAAASDATLAGVVGASSDANLTVYVSAEGGAGGGGAIGGAGGAGEASANVVGGANTHATVSASGGYGGAGAAAGDGGGANATLKVSGLAVAALATARAGLGATDGHASAKTTASGLSGVFEAAASLPNTTGQLIEQAAVEAFGAVSGKSTAKVKLVDASPAMAFTTQGSAVADETVAPLGADTAAVLSANANIATAFGASPDFFAIDELGGAYSSGGSGSETMTSTADMTVDLTQVAAPQDLLIGLFDATTLGAGFDSLTFTLVGDGQTLVSQTFTSLAAAETFFTDNPLDLGSLTSGALSNPTLTLEATLSVTMSSAGSGFYAGLIIGDPPSAGAHASRFAQAMAGMGGGMATSQPVRAGAALTEPMLALSKAAATA